MARHFETKLELFGRGKLARDIQQDDLDKETIDALYSGYTQTLPLRDRAGRLVLIWFPHPVNYSITSKVSIWMLDVVVNRFSCVASHDISCLAPKDFLFGHGAVRGRRNAAQSKCYCGVFSSTDTIPEHRPEIRLESPPVTGGLAVAV
jgi:hypothetical protein